MSNEEPKPDPASDRRKKTRYAISPTYRLNAVLALNDDTSKAAGGAWKNWAGTLVDLSATGANIQVNLAAVAFPENRCWLKLSLGPFKLDIPGTVAHFVCSARSGVCGINFDFSNSGVEKAYHRVFDTAVIGASLAPVDASSDNYGRHLEQFAGKNSSLLTVWRETDGGELNGFEFHTARYRVDADKVTLPDGSFRQVLNFSLTTARKGAESGTPMPVTDSQAAELRWLFGLTVSNLAKSVPADVRKYLQALASG